MLRNKESRKVLLAVVASVFLHLLIGLSLAAFGGGSTPLPVDDQPPELTFVDLPSVAPTPPTNPPYMETDESKKSVDAPKEKTFESNANSVAASEGAATGDDPLPTQDGKDRPFPQLTTQNLALATEGSTPQPTPEAKPVEPPHPSPAPGPSTTPLPSASPTPELAPPSDQFAMLTATPPPAFTPPEEVQSTPAPDTPVVPPVPRPRPERPSSSFQAAKEQTRITGRITNRGKSAVNATETPLGRYQKTVSDAIGSRWYHYVNSKIDLVSIGTAHVEAQVDADGKIKNLKLLSNNANEAFANICLQSFQEAQIPPIPEELVSALPDGKLSVDITFTTYANR
jgi:outer membrane biosynthesis protein TonB